MAGKYSFQLEQGVAFTRPITWKGSDDQPIDLTGLTARMELLDADGSLVQALSGGAGLAFGGEDGTIAVSLTDAQTAAFTFDTAYYDLDFYREGVLIKRLLKGVITLDHRGNA